MDLVASQSREPIGSRPRRRLTQGPASIRMRPCNERLWLPSLISRADRRHLNMSFRHLILFNKLNMRTGQARTIPAFLAHWSKFRPARDLWLAPARTRAARTCDVYALPVLF